MHRFVRATPLLLVIVLLVSVSTSVSGPAATAHADSADRDALVALYNATAGANWVNNTGWLTAAPIGEWHGVTTDGDGRVVRLSLSFNELTGPIPAELGSLSNLEWLSIWNNQLTGSIPGELGSLSNLEWLDLSSNQLTGSIPAELGGLANLESLDLGSNELTGIPPELGGLSNRNPEIPVPQLQRVNWADSCGIGQSLQPGMAVHLEQPVDWVDPWGVGQPLQPGMAGPQQQPVDWVDPCGIGRPRQPGASPPAYPDLGSNELTGALVALYNATAGANWVNNTGWLTAAPIWHGVTTDGDGRVVRLSLSFNELTGPIPAELGSLSNLEWLSIWNNQLTGSIPGELGSLSNLEWLDLSSNQLTGSIPAELGGLANLESLYLGSNELTGIPPELGGLSNLKSLSLSFNELTGPIPAELGSLSNLEWLSIWNNQLTGSIPGELGSLSNLEWLDLSSNQLTGSIPAELGGLANLESLYLGSNELTGCIPAGLRDVANHDLDRLGLPDCVGVTGPSAPQNLTATANGQTQIDLSWSAPSSDGGAAITGYRIEVSESGSTWSDLEADTGSTTTSYSHTGLTAGTTRHYRVSAINSAGTGPASNAAVGTTDPLEVPGAPTGLTGELSEDETQVDLSWTAPISDGGAPITGYKVESSDDDSGPWEEVYTTTDDGVSYTDEGADSNGPTFGVGVLRHYQVSAINSVGTGPPSNVAIAQDLFARYDANNNDKIDKSEVITAIRHYFGSVGGITKADVIQLIRLYFDS